MHLLHCSQRKLKNSWLLISSCLIYVSLFKNTLLNINKNHKEINLCQEFLFLRNLFFTQTKVQYWEWKVSKLCIFDCWLIFPCLKKLNKLVFCFLLMSWFMMRRSLKDFLFIQKAEAKWWSQNFWTWNLFH